MWFSTLVHAQGKSFMPDQGSTIAESVDQLYSFLLWASLISCILVIGGFIYFTIKYRRRSNTDKTAYISHNTLLEFLWSFIPFIIFMVVFAWGWWVYQEMRDFPEDALEVHVVGQKWNWDFVYKSGRKVSNEFYVPVNTPVKLIMSSRDVLHSFYVPGFRVKQDVVPGRYTALWFEANKLGSFNVFCTEYCGDGHSAMIAKVHVKSRAEYERWLEVDPYKGLSLTEVGQKIYSSRCIACHTTTDKKQVGPGFAGLFGSEKVMSDGTQLVADANYIRESIIKPQAKIVKGFEGQVMTSFAGQLSEQELSGIIEYLKTLKK